MPYSLITNYSEMRNKTGNKFLNHCNEVSIQSKKVSFSSIPLDVSNGRATISEPEHHCLICGTSGRGKTRRVLYPTAVLSARSRHSLIVIDPKGELYRHCSNEIRRCGHDVRILNLRNPSQGDRWSPLSLIQKYWDEGKTGRAMVLLKSVATIILSQFTGERDAYWRLAATDCFLGFALLLLEHRKTLTFAAVHSLANDFYARKSFREEFRDSLDSNADSYRHLCTLMNLDSDVTLGCVLSEFNSAITPLTDQLEIRDLLLGYDFDIVDIGRKPTAYFVILPDENSALYPVASLFVEISYEELVHYADSREENTLPVKIDYIIDEFGSLSGTDWTIKLTAARSRGIRFILAVQNLSQLETRYGYDAGQTIMSNCRTLLFIGGRDLSMMSLLSTLGGTEYDKYGIAKPRITINDLSSMEIGKVVILDDSERPHFGYLPDWTDWKVKNKAELGKTTRTLLEPDMPTLSEIINDDPELKEPPLEHEETKTYEKGSMEEFDALFPPITEEERSRIRAILDGINNSIETVKDPGQMED